MTSRTPQAGDRDPPPASQAAASDRSAGLRTVIDAAIAQAGGRLPFDRYMALALYAPGLGYYARDSRQFGTMPASGSDFVTAPEMSPLFGRALAAQVAQVLADTGTDTVVEFGAGSGALAVQLLQDLDGLGATVRRYAIVEVSSALRARQQERLASYGDRVRWLDAMPERIEGVVVGNEVLDAMPVTLLCWTGREWLERGVAVDPGSGGLCWADAPTALRPPLDGPDDAHFVPGTVTEVHPQAEAFVATVAERLARGAALFIDYGFPEREFYLPERTGGTLMCHRAHRADADPLQDPGEKDLTAHVNFTGIALAAQDAGCDVLGYATQGRFLLNCGLAALMQSADVPARVAAHRLVAEHEMGELFKVIAFGRGVGAELIGFMTGDRTHTL